jgi:hypothetical protein
VSWQDGKLAESPHQHSLLFIHFAPTVGQKSRPRFGVGMHKGVADICSKSFVTHACLLVVEV